METKLVSQNEWDEIQGWGDLEEFAAINDNLFGIGKKARSRRQARKEAKQLAKAKNLSGKTKRRFIRGMKREAVSAVIKEKNPNKAKRLLMQAEALKLGKKPPLESRSKISRGVRRLGDKVALAPFAILLPFKGMMNKALARKGVPTSRNIKDVSERFYNNVVRKSSKTGIATFEDDLPEVHFDEFYDEDHIASAITMVIDAIVNFIKRLKKKKQAGEPMKKGEEIIVQGIEQVEAQLQEKAKEEAAAEVGKTLLFDKKTQLWIVGAILGVIVLVFFAGKIK